MINLTKLVTILSIVLAHSGLGAEVNKPYHSLYEKNCLTIHVLDAIKSNSKRANKYSELSNGRSNYLTSLLIGAEVVSVPILKYFDSISINYRKAGIPLLCDDVVSMKDIDPMQGDYLIPESVAEMQTKNETREIKSLLLESYKNGGMVELELTANSLVENLMEHPNFNCMTRHIIESIRRSAGLSNGYSSQASELGLPDPENISYNFIKLQIATLDLARMLDNLAHPMQIDGIGMICRDIPYIPRAL